MLCSAGPTGKTKQISVASSPSIPFFPWVAPKGPFWPFPKLYFGPWAPETGPNRVFAHETPLSYGKRVTCWNFSDWFINGPATTRFSPKTPFHPPTSSYSLSWWDKVAILMQQPAGARRLDKTLGSAGGTFSHSIVILFQIYSVYTGTGHA